jgi:Protein of unknown function (DUF2764)
MSLVYLVTSLPRMPLSGPPPIEIPVFIDRARQALADDDRVELERLLLVEEVDETCRVVADAQRTDPHISVSALTAKVRTERKRSPRGPGVDELPLWVLVPSARHVLLRTWYRTLYSSKSPFLVSWARFAVNLEELTTGLLARLEGMEHSEFQTQMEGRFDTSSEVILRSVAKPDLGLGRRFPWFDLVKSAIENNDPLAGERALDGLRVREIDELTGMNVFEPAFVFAYYLKLRILTRQASWVREIGAQQLSHLIIPPFTFESEGIAT